MGRKILTVGTIISFIIALYCDLNENSNVLLGSLTFGIAFAGFSYLLFSWLKKFELVWSISLIHISVSIAQLLFVGLGLFLIYNPVMDIKEGPRTDELRYIELRDRYNEDDDDYTFWVIGYIGEDEEKEEIIRNAPENSFYKDMAGKTGEKKRFTINEETAKDIEDETHLVITYYENIGELLDYEKIE